MVRGVSAAARERAREQNSNAGLHAWLETGSQPPRIRSPSPPMRPAATRACRPSFRASTPPRSARGSPPGAPPARRSTPCSCKGSPPAAALAPVRPDPLVDGQSRARPAPFSPSRRRWRPTTPRCGSTSARRFTRAARPPRRVRRSNARWRSIRRSARAWLGLALVANALDDRETAERGFRGGAEARPAALRGRVRPRPAVLRAAALRRGRRVLASRDRRWRPQRARPRRARPGAVLHRRFCRRRARNGDPGRQRRRRRPEAHATLRPGALPRSRDRRRRRRGIRRLSRGGEAPTRKTKRRSRGPPFRCSAPMAIATRRCGSAARGCRIGDADPIQRYLFDAVAGEKLDRAPRDYLVAYFDRFAETFDKQLVDVLGYDVPEKLTRTRRRDRQQAAARGRSRLRHRARRPAFAAWTIAARRRRPVAAHARQGREAARLRRARRSRHGRLS